MLLWPQPGAKPAARRPLNSARHGDLQEGEQVKTTRLRHDNGPLSAPERNHYFYGKLLDESALQQEQVYSIKKRRLINRLALGSGVLCGLNVVLEQTDRGRFVAVQPGVALDANGREIIVPEPVTIDPHRLTDEEGSPIGDPLVAGDVEICVTYTEQLVNPVPVLIPECDTPGNCAPGTIREGYWLHVRRAEERPPAPPSCSLDEFPLPVDERLHDLLCQRISRGCPDTAVDPCVPLARVSLPLREDSIEPCSGRALVYNNALLFELILCLANRLESVTQGFALRIISGDRQSGPQGRPLPERLVVAVLDNQDRGVRDVVVQFRGNGQQAPEITRTDEEGRAQTRWTLDQAPGEQQVVVSSAGSLDKVIFVATAI